MKESAVEWRKNLWVIPGLWLTGALTFLPLLGNRFIADDFTALSIFRAYRSKPFFQTVLYGGNDFFRPLNMALIMARGALFGDAPLPYVAANIILHLVNATLVFLIARRVFKRTLAAAAAGFLFLVAFSHYEAITWVSSSVTLFVTLFVLISIYGHVRFREKGGIGWLIFAIAGFILAFLTKETAVALPFILLACDLLLVKKEKRSKGFFYPYAIYGALLAAYLAIQTGWAVRFMGTDSIYKAGWHVLTNVADYWVWLWMPNPRHPYVAGVLSILPRGVLVIYWIIAGAAALTLPLIVALAVLKKLSRPMLWSFICSILALLVFLPFTIKISARYAYLPSVFVAMFAGGLFSRAYFYLREKGRRARRVWQMVLVIAGSLYLIGNVAGLLLIQREFVKVSTSTERLALRIGELVELADEDVIFIEGLPAHVHLREAVQWFHNPTVHVHADNDKYRGTPKTLEATREFYRNSEANLYHLRFEDDNLFLLSRESLLDDAG
jgi:hypothetical protein